jgi:lysyl-tRNA synthetase class 2
MATLRELRDERIKKLQKLREIGVDPYPATSHRNIDNIELHKNFEEYEGKEIVVAGRVDSNREHGQLAFIDLRDNTGKIQLYIKADQVTGANHSNSELNFEELNLLDLNDFVEGHGTVTKTKRGEISVEVSKIRILTKAIRPIPEELNDKEIRLRRRYLDTNINRDVYERFERRAKFWEAHREFFKNEGFLEMNIPVLEAVTGGADANPFVTHMDALDTDFYLRISQELYLKRLIGGGYHKVYEIGPRFRNEGYSDEHLPEHIAMEYYWAYADYRDGMEFTKELFRYVYQQVYGTLKFNIKGFEVDLSKEWELIDYTQVIKDRFNIDIFNTNLDEIKNVLKTNRVSFDETLNVNRGIDSVWKIIRKTIGGPAFMINEPKFMSPLAKSDPETPELTQRFHPMIAGSELGNAFSELNDPIDQLERFLEQQNLRDSGDAEAQMLDIDFVEMLEYGMPPTFGYGHSERNFWFFEDVPAREGVPFPQLRHEIDDVTKSIYPQIYKTESKPQVDYSNDTTDYDALYTKAEQLLGEFIKNEGLQRHCRDVEKCMKFYAKKLGENESKWAISGLLHDIDWETDPDTHPNTAVPILEKLGVGQEVIDAILGHGYPNYADTPRQSTLAHYLFACDELSGFIMAYSRMKPLDQLEPAAVIKKLKDKSFAAKVSREDIYLGVEEIGLPIEEHIQNLLNALKSA